MIILYQLIFFYTLLVSILSIAIYAILGWKILGAIFLIAGITLLIRNHQRGGN